MVLPYNGGKHKISNHNIKPSRWYYGLAILVFKTTGSKIPLSHSSMNSTYSVGGRSGVSVLEFLIDKPGAYELSAWYPEGKEGTEVVLAIGHGFTGKLVRSE